MLVENFPNVIKPSKQFYCDAFGSQKDINYSPTVKKTKYTLNEIHGKTQEILRKSKINLPYHVPPKLTLSQLENGEISTLDDQDIKIFDSFKKISHTAKTYIDYVESSDEEALFTTSPYLPIKSITKPADKIKNNFVKKRLDFSNFLSRDASKLINSEMLKFENNVCDDITSSKYVTIVSDKNPRNIIRPTNLNPDTNFRSFQNRFTLHASYKTPQVKKNLNPEKRSNEKITKNLLQKGHEKINNKLKLNEIKDFNTLQDSLLPILKQKRIVALQQRQKAYENYNKKNKKSRHNTEEIDVEESIMQPEKDNVLESQDCFVENNFDKIDYGRKLAKKNINSLEIMSVVKSERQSSALESVDLFKSSQSTPLIINSAISSNNMDKENTTLGQEETACDALDWGAYFSRCLTTQKNLNHGISIENDSNSATTATAKILKFDFSHVKTPEKSEVDSESQTLRIEEIRRNVNKLFGIQSPSKQHQTENIGDNQVLEIEDDFSNSCSIVSQKQEQETQTQIEENVKTFGNDASNIMNRINNPFENKNNGKEMLDFSLQNTQHNLSMLGELLTPIGAVTLSPDRTPMVINQKSPSLNNSSFTDDENLDSNVSIPVVNENNGQPKMKKTIILSSDDEDLDGIKPLTKVQKPKIFSKKISSDTETTNIFWNENDDKNNAKDLPIDTTFDCDNVSKNSDDDDVDSDIEQNDSQASNISNSKRQQSFANKKNQNSDTSEDEIESDNSSQNEQEGTSLKDDGYRDEEDEFLEYVKGRPEKIELNEYIDEEAELSGSDVGKDELENDDDDYEIDIEAENFNMDETELKDELGRIHRKVTLDQDKREIRALQEIFFDDPDDPENVKNLRVKRFKWNFDEVIEKNNGDIGKNNKLFSDDEEEADESLQIANGKQISGDHTDKNNTSFDCHQNKPLKLKMQLMTKLPFANTMENAMGIDVENSAGNNACTVKETAPVYKTENKEDDISNEMTRMKFRFEREQLMANVVTGGSTATKQTNETTIGVNHFKQLGLSKTKEIKTPFNIIKRQSALATLNNVKEKIIQKMPSFNISATSNSLLFSDSSSKIVKHLNEDSNSLVYGNASTSKLSNENFIFKKLSPSIKLGKHKTSTRSVQSAMPTTTKHTKRSIMKNSIFKYF